MPDAKACEFRNSRGTAEGAERCRRHSLSIQAADLCQAAKNQLKKSKPRVQGLFRQVGHKPCCIRPELVQRCCGRNIKCFPLRISPGKIRWLLRQNDLPK